jgi:hypothetical protein
MTTKGPTRAQTTEVVRRYDQAMTSGNGGTPPLIVD